MAEKSFFERGFKQVDNFNDLLDDQGYFDMDQVPDVGLLGVLDDFNAGRLNQPAGPSAEELAAFYNSRPAMVTPGTDFGRRFLRPPESFQGVDGTVIPGSAVDPNQPPVDPDFGKRFLEPPDSFQGVDGTIPKGSPVHEPAEVATETGGVSAKDKALGLSMIGTGIQMTSQGATSSSALEPIAGIGMAAAGIGKMMGQPWAMPVAILSTLAGMQGKAEHTMNVIERRQNLANAFGNAIASARAIRG